jgi:hypothetical protein
MPRNRIALPSVVQTALPPRRPNQIMGAEEAPSRQSFGIDDYFASPWIGLHYRHEFLLHCNHELLEHQNRKD